MNNNIWLILLLMLGGNGCNNNGCMNGCGNGCDNGATTLNNLGNNSCDSLWIILVCLLATSGCGCNSCGNNRCCN